MGGTPGAGSPARCSLGFFWLGTPHLHILGRQKDTGSPPMARYGLLMTLRPWCYREV